MKSACPTAQPEILSHPLKLLTAAAFRKRVLISVAAVVTALGLIYFVWQAVYVLLLIFAGVLLAIFLRALADWLTRATGWPTKLTLSIVIVTLLALGALLVWQAVPRVVAQVDQFVDQFPQAVAPVEQKLGSTKIGTWLLSNGHLQDLLNPEGTKVFSRAIGYVTNLSGAIASLVVIAFIGVYLAFEPTVYTNGLLRLLPREHRPRGAEVLGAMNHTLKWWLVAQFIDMWIIGTAIAVGFWLMGVELALLLGILAGLFNFIPNFGPLIAMAPAALIALMESPSKAIAVISLSLVMQTIEGYVLLPLLQRKAVDLPPVLTIAAQVLMGVLLGPLGLVLAAPLMVVTMVLVQMLYVEDALGDEIETPADGVKPHEVPPVPGKDADAGGERGKRRGSKDLKPGRARVR